MHDSHNKLHLMFSISIPLEKKRDSRQLINKWIVENFFLIE